VLGSFFATVTGVTNEMWVRMRLSICKFCGGTTANEARRISRRASGPELELSKHHYFSDAISTTSSFDWFLANSVCRDLICIWLPKELFRFHTSARKYCWP
jgi:hypothetical protein